MGVWRSSKAEVAAAKLGEDLLVQVAALGFRPSAALLSPYHAGFLYRMLVYLTATGLRADPNARDIQTGVAFAIDRLRRRYCPDSWATSAAAFERSITDPSIAAAVQRDVDTFVKATRGDETTLRNLKHQFAEDHPSYVTAARQAGLDMDNYASRFYSRAFLETLRG